MIRRTDIRRCRPAGRLLLAAWLLQSGVPAMAAEPAAGTALSFVACPVARDTGPDTDLCFFTEHDGHRYALVNPPDWGVPQLKHRVLVEGRVGSGPPVCGATPLEGRASVLTELDESCNLIVPFDGVIGGAAGGVFNSGTPQQRAARQELARRAALDPQLSVQPAILDPPVPPAPEPPFKERTLVITYPFDSDRGSGPDMLQLKALAAYAQAAGFRHVKITGYRGVSRLADGRDMTEKPTIAESRAHKAAAILGILGIDPAATQVRWEDGAIAGRGEEDWRNRKVEVTVSP